MKREAVGNILFGIGFIMTLIGGWALIIWMITLPSGALINPWVFLPIAIGGCFMLWWGEKISYSPKAQSFLKTSPPKSSKPRNPWIEVPKVEKKEDKETKDDIPKIWKDRVLGET